MITHELKCLPPYFDAIARGDKPFEVRRDDRGFQKGDHVKLFRWDEARGYDSGKVRERVSPLDFEITYILSGGQLGIEPGYVVLGLFPVSPGKVSQ